MPRPIIGLTTYAEDARFGLQDTFSAVLPLAYVHAVHETGGRAVLITPDDPDPEVLDSLDGIMFTGGSDVDPALYGEEPHGATRVRPQRDRAEILLLRAATDRGLPLLGICRGMQLMAVAYGGRLHQHLPDVLGHHGHRPVSGPKFGWHPVELVSGSRAQAILGDRVTVNSFHHQGVADPGRLQATGWCPEDTLIEVVEDPELPFALGVQWHPEDTDDFRVIAAFVEAAVKHRVSID
ncbi:MAG: gamma-glutamyl-gamma-aminobutyrate hydrolase [Actinobacteria bacterium 13_1_20CM_3_71_11]|nr:MAG: gamma-glutamyl-gamma-aminobutyrate hydrolase [Actinobacteria bacterium 13_1_20CM_3_71_11]